MIRWLIRYFGYEAEIKKETKAEVAEQIDEVVAFITTADGTPIIDKNPDVERVLYDISTMLKKAHVINPNTIRENALIHIGERKYNSVVIEFVLHSEEAELNDFIAFLDMCRYQLQELINSHDGEPNEEDHRRTIKQILDQREWEFPFFPADLTGYKPENYE